MLAKKGTQIIQQPNTYKSFHFTKLFIKNLIKQNWKALLTSRVTARIWKSSFDRGIFYKHREKAVSEFRIAVGHDCLAAHLYRIDIFTSPNCPLCEKNVVMDRNHLLGCPALRGDSEVTRYWSARHQLMRH